MIPHVFLIVFVFDEGSQTWYGKRAFEIVVLHVIEQVGNTVKLEISRREH